MARKIGVTEAGPSDRDLRLRHDPVGLRYIPFALGMMLAGLGVYLYLRSSLIEAAVLAGAAVVVWFSSLVVRMGIAGVAAAGPTMLFLAILFFFPLEYRVDREYFAATAQCIPVLFIAFAIESGVVKHRTRGEVKLLAVLLAVLLTVGEAAALSGLAAANIEDATVFQLTATVAALAAGFTSIIVSMLIRESVEPLAGRLGSSSPVSGGPLGEDSTSSYVQASPTLPISRNGASAGPLNRWHGESRESLLVGGFVGACLTWLIMSRWREPRQADDG